MTEIKELIHDIKAAIRTGLNEWKRCRWLRKYGNPDVCPF